MSSRFANLFEQSKKKKIERLKPKSGETQKNKKGSHQKKRRRPDNNETNRSNEGRNIHANNHDKKQRTPNNSNTNKKQQQREWKPPSEAALALSKALQELSSRKRLHEALKLYWDKRNDGIRDAYHGSTMIDCCSRCGAVEEGEKVMKAMLTAAESNHTTVPVQANTSLLKGYAHGTDRMHKALDLFQKMYASKNKRDHPNVRTLNTFLRGCLWQATTTVQAENDNYVCCGGVVASEAVWQLCQRKNKGKIEKNKLHMDGSSYEYSIQIL